MMKDVHISRRSVLLGMPLGESYFGYLAAVLGHKVEARRPAPAWSVSAVVLYWISIWPSTP